jgi:chemotaxis-related protein WspD
MPHRRNGILLGLANWRGELLTCVSLSALLGISAESSPQGPASKPAPPTMEKGVPSVDATAAKSRGTARMIVLNWRDSRLGFPADDVHGTVRFRMAALQSPPPVLQAGPGCALGLFDWGGRVVTFLDTERLMVLLNENLA